MGTQTKTELPRPRYLAGSLTAFFFLLGKKFTFLRIYDASTNVRVVNISFTYQLEYAWPSVPVSSEPEWTSAMPGSVWSTECKASLMLVTHVVVLLVMGS